MDENVDMDPGQVAALEERLYSQFHHSYEVTPNSNEPLVPMADSEPLRIISKTSVVNYPKSANLMSKMKRYWTTTERFRVRTGAQNSYFSKQNNSYLKEYLEPTQTSNNRSSEPKRMFLSNYQSLLGNSQHDSMNNRATLPLDTASKVTNEGSSLKKTQCSVKPKPARNIQKELAPKRNLKSLKHAVEKNLFGSSKLVNKKTSQSRKERFQVKKVKANVIRQMKPPRVVARVFLSSSDEEPVPRSVSLADKTSEVIISDGEADEVIIVPLPEPPKICIDCSDEEVTQDSFAFPQAKSGSKSSAAPKLNSPRCISPSNSSMMSDDFINLRDRSRLNDSFTENIANDDELECSVEGRSGKDVNKRKQIVAPSRDQRAPSISSEETISTSSDTTDQEKRRQELSKGNKSKTFSPTPQVVGTGGSGTHGEPGSKNSLSSPSQETLQPHQTPPPSSGGFLKKGRTKNIVSSVQTNKQIAPNSKAKSKSAISMALELTRKHFEGNNLSEHRTSSAKTKSKTDTMPDANHLPVAQELPPLKRVARKQPKARVKDGSKGGSFNRSVTEPKAHLDSVLFDEDSISSESDYELAITQHKGSSHDGSKERAIGSSENLSSTVPSSSTTLPRLDLMGNISSESDYDTSFAQALKSTPKNAKLAPTKRVGRKRKQYNSENFSDEDFACMLSDIVRAVSDTDSEEEEDEHEQEQGGTMEHHATEGPTEAVTCTTTPTAFDCRAAYKITEKGSLQTKKKRSADASKTHRDGQNVAKCMMSGASTTATAEQNCETPEMQTKADGPPSTRKKKRLNDASIAAPVSVVEVGKQGGLKNLQMNTVTTTSVTAYEEHDHEAQTAGPYAQSRKRQSDISSSANYNGNTSSVATTSTAVEEQNRQTHAIQSNVDSLSCRKKKLSKDALNATTASIIDVETSDNHAQQTERNRVGDNMWKSQTLELPDCAWNEEMKLFYNSDWTDEDFSLSSVMQKMPRGKKHWPILQQDLYPDPPKRELICRNCGEPGHARSRCKNAPKIPACHMCGELGHREPRCPRTICLSCGGVTRSFVRSCNSCRYLSVDSVCGLCRSHGHRSKTCPDQWRRYHSTTEDDVPLKQNFKLNTSTRNCSICGKPGHYAHSCNAAHRIFGMGISTVLIQSYKRTYPDLLERKVVMRRDQNEETPKYNLFSTNANSWDLNLHQLTENQNGFYYRFAKSTGLLAGHEQRLNHEKQSKLQPLQQANQKKMLSNEPSHQEQTQEKNPLQKHSMAQEQELKEGSVEANDSNVAGTISSERQNDAERVDNPSLDAFERPGNENGETSFVSSMQNEDSNYNFSEFVTEKKCAQHNSARIAPPSECAADTNEPSSNIHHVWEDADCLSDFIPLSLESEPARLGLSAVEDDHAKVCVTDAKIFLTESHGKILRTARGADFLSESMKRNCLQLSLSSQTIGNILFLHGEADAQDCFHNDLVNFLNRYDTEYINMDLLALNPIPKTMRDAFHLIAKNLREVTRIKSDAHLLYRAYETINDAKERRRTRTVLNTVLFGQFGLRDGRKHLNTLCAHFLETVNYTSPKDMLSPVQREAIKDAFMYIFSSYDHIDYEQLLSEYDELRRTKRLDRVSFSDLQLPPLPVKSKAANYLRVNDQDLYNWFNCRGQLANTAHRKAHFRQDDIVLNTYDHKNQSGRFQRHQTFNSPKRRGKPKPHRNSS